MQKAVTAPFLFFHRFPLSPGLSSLAHPGL